MLIRRGRIYNVLFGLFQAPYYAYAQTMMSEVTPRGYENMFFGLFGITNRASSIIGPNIVQAIINSTNNNWMGFPFLFSLCFAASVVIWFVDIEKGRENCRKYVEERKLMRVARESGLTTDEVIDGVITGELVPEATSSDSGSVEASESLEHHLGIDDVWRKLNAAFAIVPGIVYYEPVMRKFLREFFRTLLKDGVRWVEFRTAPFTRFVLEGQEEACSDPSGVMRAIAEEIEGFKRNMRECIRLKKDYPDVISGYDLVGHEDSGRTLRSLTPELLWFQSECRQQQVNIPFFF
ncbi:Adenosine deaminase, partial [Lachnellula willkommii]